ncbi:hypothetical protein M2194_004969 [Bradyrhizobium elkanii]|nr:hypothetical protein [Bradyrhizobium elkanii]
MKCQLCGLVHEFKCHLIKAYDYYPDGTVKRVEFITAADLVERDRPASETLLSLPTHGTRQ